MKFSIITITYNASSLLDETIQSVLAQRNAEYEYLIIDGNSTDDTVERAKSYGRRITRIVSEPDRGIYDAMNKGIRLASGDVIGLINAGDRYEPGAFATVEKALAGRDPSGVIFWGDVRYEHLGRVRGFREENRYRGAFAPHPSMFCPRAVYEKIGLYDDSYRLLGDYEFMYRAVNICGIEPVYVPEIIAFYREGGLSDRNVLGCLRDELRVKLHYGQNPLLARSVFALKVLKNLPRIL